MTNQKSKTFGDKSQYGLADENDRNQEAAAVSILQAPLAAMYII